MLPSMGICLQLGWLLVQEAWCVCRSFFIASATLLYLVCFRLMMGRAWLACREGFFTVESKHGFSFF